MRTQTVIVFTDRKSYHIISYPAWTAAHVFKNLSKILSYSICKQGGYYNLIT